VKRAEALRPLSRDHHQALFVAQRLRRAERVDDAVEVFLGFWREHGYHHFRVEEEVLLPVWASLGNADDDAVARIAVEHLSIRRAALEMESERPSLEQLQALGELLDAHVRFEERELFPRIEKDLSEESLRRLGAEVEAAEVR
jgi:hemerythrin-like domain-containing protein